MFNERFKAIHICFEIVQISMRPWVEGCDKNYFDPCAVHIYLNCRNENFILLRNAAFSSGAASFSPTIFNQFLCKLCVQNRINGHENSYMMA